MYTSVLPEINLKAKQYHQRLSPNKITKPAAISYLNEKNLTNVKTSPLKLMHACHNQAVERRVKIVSDAASQVTSFEERDGLMR